MLEISLCLALAGLIGLLFFVQRQMAEERRAWSLERTGLLQRIQAPELAVVSHANEGQPIDPPAVSLDDDADYWAQKADELLQLERERLNGAA